MTRTLDERALMAESLLRNIMAQMREALPVKYKGLREWAVAKQESERALLRRNAEIVLITLDFLGEE